MTLELAINRHINDLGTDLGAALTVSYILGHAVGTTIEEVAITFSAGSTTGGGQLFVQLFHLQAPLETEQRTVIDTVVEVEQYGHRVLLPPGAGTIDYMRPLAIGFALAAGATTDFGEVDVTVVMSKDENLEAPYDRNLD